MFESLAEGKWDEIPQPEWNSPTEVPEALREILNVQDEVSAERAYHRLLFALGNDHAGTYYPVAVSAVPFIGEALRHDKSLVRETALNVLVDLVGSFGPELGFETIRSASGLEMPLEGALRGEVVKLRPQLLECLSTAAKGSEEYGLLMELIGMTELS
jgi:hypothetical protein